MFDPASSRWTLRTVKPRCLAACACVQSRSWRKRARLCPTVCGMRSGFSRGTGAIVERGTGDGPRKPT